MFMPFQKNMLNSIIEECRLQGNEQPWIEFKENNCDPQMIGEYISALSNTATLFSRSNAYMIWGISDASDAYVGTTFDPASAKVGNQGLDLWISTQLEPQVQFYFHKTKVADKNMVLLEIGAAQASPVKFKSVDFIRIDSHKKKLKDFPDTERELWAALSQMPFEDITAMENVSGDFALRLLDYASYFDMLSLDLPSEKSCRS